MVLIVSIFVADPFLMMVVHPVATVVNPPITIVPRMMLVVIAIANINGGWGVVCRPRRVPVARRTIVRFEAALNCQHPEDEGSRLDRENNLDRKSTRLNSSHANISYA